MAEMIIEEAGLLHVECARERYGDAIVDILTENVSADAALDLSDEEQETLSSLTYVEGDADGDSPNNPFKDETGRPQSCDACGGYLVEDTMPAPSPVARDILNLTVEARSFNATRMASGLADVARKLDYTPRSLVQRMVNEVVSADDADGQTIKDQAILIAQEWGRMYDARKVVALHTDDDGNLRDAQGVEWIEYDMRGYLDMYGDGDMECSTCGRQLESHVYYDEYSDEECCPDCVTVD